MKVVSVQAYGTLAQAIGLRGETTSLNQMVQRVNADRKRDMEAAAAAAKA